MQWETVRNESPQLIWVKVRGAFDVRRAKEVFQEIADIKGSNPFFPILIDDRNADLSGLEASDLISLGNLFMQSQAVFAYSKVALLMNPGRDYETAQKFQSLTKDKFVSFSIFSSE